MGRAKATRLTKTISSTSPLQLISTPIVNDSLHTNPLSLAAAEAPIILLRNATTVVAKTYPHARPLSRSPRFVFKPESVKYSGKSNAPIRSSSFSVTRILKRSSRGTMRPTMNAPKMGCTPIIPVKKAAARVTRTMSDIMPCDGPF